MKILMKGTLCAYFRAKRLKLCGNCAFPQNFHTRKLGETSVCKNMSQVFKIRFKQIVSVLFQCFIKALEYRFDNLFESKICRRGILSLGGFLRTLRCDTDATCKQSLCPNDFFCSLPSKLVSITRFF